jgi:hypothetical protein
LSISQTDRPNFPIFDTAGLRVEAALCAASQAPQGEKEGSAFAINKVDNG